jgi:hypothetical protein
MPGILSDPGSARLPNGLQVHAMHEALPFYRSLRGLHRCQPCTLGCREPAQTVQISYG